MVLGVATSAMALTWGAPTAGASASAPFTAEVIKLGANAGVTGYEYYSVINNAAAYNYSNIYYAIKLSIPSAAQANAAYSGATYSVGDTIKVTINYTNVQNKTAEVKYVKIGASAKTLWYNGKTGEFEESWVPSVSNATGCGDQHVIKATALGTGEVKIKVCFAANGKLSDLKLAGCYTVESKEYCGVKPCPNCVPVDIKGYKFAGECAKFPVFFSTNSAGRVLGAYVIDTCGTYTQDAYGSMKKMNDSESKLLYGWAVTNAACNVCTTCPGTATQFELVPLERNTVLHDWVTWNNNNTVGGLSAQQTYERFIGSCGYLASGVYTSYDIGTGSKVDLPVNSTARQEAYNTVYFKRADNTFISVKQMNNLGKIADDLSLNANLYKNAKAGSVVSTPATTAPGGATFTATTTAIAPLPLAATKLNVGTINAAAPGVIGYDAMKWLDVTRDSNRFVGKSWSKYTTNDVVYLDTHYFCYEASTEQLFAQLTVDRVNCDTNDAAYLNSLNHLYSVLGFTYADVMAGNVYMNDYILLSNFGFAIAPCGEAVWGAYTASITVAPVAEVPATGDVGFMGFLFIGLSAVAAVANRKRTNAK